MCTAAAYRTKDFYFGRTPDYESSCVADGYPLCYEAVNAEGVN